MNRTRVKVLKIGLLALLLTLGLASIVWANNDVYLFHSTGAGGNVSGTVPSSSRTSWPAYVFNMEVNPPSEDFEYGYCTDIHNPTYPGQTTYKLSDFPISCEALWIVNKGDEAGVGDPRPRSDHNRRANVNDPIPLSPAGDPWPVLSLLSSRSPWPRFSLRKLPLPWPPTGPRSPGKATCRWST